MSSETYLSYNSVLNTMCLKVSVISPRDRIFSHFVRSQTGVSFIWYHCVCTVHALFHKKNTNQNTEMSFRRAIWAEDATVTRCTKCRVEFTYRVPKHHCRKCGLIFCKDCSRSKMIVPQDELVPRPQSWWQTKLPPDLATSDEDNFRCPQRVCDPCSFQLKDMQQQLRLQVSR
jgi:hypothetical protein